MANRYNKQLMKEKCSKCGYSDIRALCVHHIDRQHKNNDLSNLQVLCNNCHKIEHKQDDINRLKMIHLNRKNGKIGGRAKLKADILLLIDKMTINKDKELGYEILDLLKIRIDRVGIKRTKNPCNHSNTYKIKHHIEIIEEKEITYPCGIIDKISKYDKDMLIEAVNRVTCEALP